MVSALIFAGGIGQRMKSLDIPKQFLEIEGKPIIVRTMEHFSNHPMVDNIVVVCVENWLDVLNQDIEKFGIKKVMRSDREDAGFDLFAFSIADSKTYSWMFMLIAHRKAPFIVGVAAGTVKHPQATFDYSFLVVKVDYICHGFHRSNRE